LRPPILPAARKSVGVPRNHDDRKGGEGGGGKRKGDTPCPALKTHRERKASTERGGGKSLI